MVHLEATLKAARDHSIVVAHRDELERDNVMLRKKVDQMFEETLAIRTQLEDVVQEKCRATEEVSWMKELLTKKDIELATRGAHITELSVEMDARVEAAKVAAVTDYKLGEGAAKIAWILEQQEEKRTRQVQDMYTGAVAQTLYILEHDLDICGVRPDQFSSGVSHLGYLRYLTEAKVEEVFGDEES